ncbi:MAG TPA: GTPase Era [Rhodanobacteraceae bacterium]|nr:GTPase Era [Rhodanobacteraceae bacterium]
MSVDDSDRVGAEGAPTRRFGHVALLGRPNVGKSTLLNTLIGTRLSIVTSKPQTTRHRILGVANRPDAQLVFLDTPGLHEVGKRAINRRLNRIARQVPDEADVLAHVIEALRWNADDEQVWRLLARHRQPRLLVINKVDRVIDKTALLPFAAEITGGRDYAGVHYVVARRGDGVEALLDDLVARLPYGPSQYDEDAFTDRSERFLAAEFVREQLMLQLSAELPYAVAVEIERFEEEDGLARIAAVIWVERDTQKAIVIGAGGKQLKRIGSDARRAMERLFGRRVFLQLWVRVRADWSDDDVALGQFGYGDG